MRYELSWNDARVRAVHTLPGDVRMLEIEPGGGASSYPPGSHIEVRVEIDGQPDERHYSLIGDRPADGAYRVAVSHHPDSRGGSEYMRALEPGDRLSVSDPQNLFPLSYGAPEYLLVAGGIGITPVVGMAHVLDRRDEPLRLVYAGRRRASMPFLDELSERLGDRLTVCVSEEGTRMDVEAEIAQLHDGAELYVCGPRRLIDACRRAWAAAGRHPAALRMETFANSGEHAPEPFVVHVSDHEADVEVPARRTMLSSLREAGVHVMYDCLRGECGLCAVDVLDIEGEIDHRDVFLSDEERAQARKICTCVSRAVGGRITIDTGYRHAGVESGRRTEMFDAFSPGA
jgi:vanillate monooxygenase ferredoxin subunit